MNIVRPRIRIRPNFFLDEVMDIILYERFQTSSRWFVDARILDVVQRLREICGVPFTVNNWWDGGNRSRSGYRRLDEPIGGRFSQHKFGRAIDFQARGMTPTQILEVIQAYWPELKALGLTTVEDVRDTPTWTHIDCRYTGLSNLLIVRP